MKVCIETTGEVTYNTVNRAHIVISADKYTYGGRDHTSHAVKYPHEQRDTNKSFSDFLFAFRGHLFQLSPGVTYGNRTLQRYFQFKYIFHNMHKTSADILNLLLSNLKNKFIVDLEQHEGIE